MKKIFLLITLILTTLVMNAHASPLESLAGANGFSFSNIVKKTSPAVVGIQTYRKTAIQSAPHPFFNDPFFRQFFGDFHSPVPRQYHRRNSQPRKSGQGSGVLISSDGYIITNHHVIDRSDRIKVFLSDEREFEAKVIGTDKASDLAVIKIPEQSHDFPFISLGNSDQVETGDVILVIGNPYGFSHSVSSGIVSSIARTNLKLRDYEYYIQTDAAINPGNSGGAMVNLKGELIGVPTAIFTGGGVGFLGIGWAIPSNLVKNVAYSLIETGQVIRPVLGITTDSLTKEKAKELGLDQAKGVLITVVRPQSPAAQAGLKQGDVILAINEKVIPDLHGLRYHLGTLQIGQEVNLKIFREGQALNIKTVLTKTNQNFPDLEAKWLDGKHPLSGSLVASLTSDLAKEMGLKSMKGVVVLEVKKQSNAEELGLKTGDLIVKLNSRSIGNLDRLDRLLSQRFSQWEIYVQRQGRILRALVKN